MKNTLIRNLNLPGSSPFGIRYRFHLEDAVDCPEYIVPFPVFKKLAAEYDLELVFAKNSHEFVHEYMKRQEFVDLMRRLGVLGDDNRDRSTLSRDEGEAAYLYMAFVLRKGLWLQLLKLGATDDPLSSFEYGTILEGIGCSGFVECLREHTHSGWHCQLTEEQFIAVKELKFQPLGFGYSYFTFQDFKYMKEQHEQHL